MIRCIEGKTGKIVRREDGSIALTAKDLATAIRYLGELMDEESLGRVQLRRTPDKNLRITLDVLQLPPRRPRQKEQGSLPKEQTRPAEAWPSEKDEPIWGVWFKGDGREPMGWCEDAGDKGPVTKAACRAWFGEFGAYVPSEYAIVTWSKDGPLTNKRSKEAP